MEEIKKISLLQGERNEPIWGLVPRGIKGGALKRGFLLENCRAYGQCNKYAKVTFKKIGLWEGVKVEPLSITTLLLEGGTQTFKTILVVIGRSNGVHHKGKFLRLKDQQYTRGEGKSASFAKNLVALR